MGDPKHAKDMDRIERAAELGGASDIIKNLPKGYNSYLECPVVNHFSKVPEGTFTLNV